MLPYDYSFVNATASIAVYDDFSSAPHIINIEAAPTNDFIEHLASTTYEQSKLAGGNIPYTVIREVSENFIHAQFKEIVVSIFDGGNTVRFADQGPGIPEKDRAQRPGFTSATAPMKKYIRGVGSGFPIVKDYLDAKNGTITVEDNLRSGAVVTISLNNRTEKQTITPPASETVIPTPHLTEREKLMLTLLDGEGALGVTEISNILDFAPSSTHHMLTKLEEAGLIEKTAGQKRIVTEIGHQVASTLN